MDHNNGTKNDWCDARTDIVRKGWENGLTCRQIANQLGPAFTKNAVIGKVRRLNLPFRAMANQQGGRLNPRRQKPTAKQRAAFGFIPMPRKNPPEFRPAPIPQPQPDDVARVSFVDLADNECKFPVGDVVSPHEKQFCGLERSPGLPYCAHHYERCYGPTPGPKLNIQPSKGHILLNSTAIMRFESA